MSSSIGSLQKLMHDDLKSRAGEVLRQFSIMEQENRHSIPEMIFVHSFLPLFSGKALPDKEERLAAWYNIASSPYHAVNVVASTGKIVAVVPPLLNREMKFPNAGNNINLGHVFETARQSATMSPKLAEGIINNAISERFMKSEENQSELEKQWIVLLTHYGEMSAGASAKNAPEQESLLDL